MKSAEEYFGQYAYKSYATLEKAIYLPELETIIKADRQQVREMIEEKSFTVFDTECEDDGKPSNWIKVIKLSDIYELLNKLQELK